ncbi:hypothetical protein N0V82_005292 [Gnomoniopsis sp. IMI 355080]|nr:hypothetical protein N0V82_005292 [Gnomoniopsis sp. IMI 355080]
MTTTTLHKFPELSAELRLEVWRLFLNDEVFGRRVVIWDGRVVPFAHLASPLLSVNVETRECALEFYPTKVDVYSLRQPGETSGSSRGRSSDRASTSQVDLIDRHRQHSLTGHGMARKIRARLDVVETATPAQGAVYLNPTRDLIFHGYDCGVYFFARQNTDLSADEKESSNGTCRRNFSSKLLPSFYQAAKQVIRVVIPHPFSATSETRLYNHESISQKRAQTLWKPFPMIKGKIVEVLELEENESDGFMQRISRSPKHPPGKIEEWREGCGTLNGEQLTLSNVTGELKMIQYFKNNVENKERSLLAELDALEQSDECSNVDRKMMIGKLISKERVFRARLEETEILWKQSRALLRAERQAYWA